MKFKRSLFHWLNPEYDTEEEELSKIFNTSMKITKAKDIYDFAAENDIEELKAAFSAMKTNPINSLNKQGHTLLGIAAQNNCLDVARFLYQNGANINNKDGTGFTPLHWAASKGHKEIVAYLFDKGADTSIEGGNNNNTPFLEAVDNGYPDIVKFLHEHNASNRVNPKSFEWAVEFINSETIPSRNYLEVEAYLQGAELFD